MKLSENIELTIEQCVNQSIFDGIRAVFKNKYLSIYHKTDTGWLFECLHT